MLELPLSATELAQMWAKHRNGVPLSAFEINRLFDTLVEKNGRFEFVVKTARDYYDREKELKFYVESWIKDVGYAENDFVVTEYNVKTLLDKIHPQWRSVFNKEEEPIFAKLSLSDIAAIKFIADVGIKNKDVSVELEED